MVTLWRAAPAVEPHFGQGSYWTASEQFAERFRLWLDQTYGGTHLVYRAEVELDSVLDVPFGVPISSTEVSARVTELAAEGYQWVTFYEGFFEGSTSREFVYLGSTPIGADLVDD